MAAPGILLSELPSSTALKSSLETHPRFLSPHTLVLLPIRSARTRTAACRSPQVHHKQTHTPHPFSTMAENGTTIPQGKTAAGEAFAESKGKGKAVAENAPEYAAMDEDEDGDSDSDEDDEDDGDEDDEEVGPRNARPLASATLRG